MLMKGAMAWSQPNTRMNKHYTPDNAICEYTTRLEAPNKKDTTNRHDDCAEQEQEHQVRCLAAEGPFLQKAAVPHHEVHVKQEVNGEETEEEKVGEHPPYLSFRHNELVVEVQRKW